MRTPAIIIALAALAAPVAAQEIALASGLSVHLFETIDEGATVRFRFVSPAVAGLTYESVREDFLALCESVAIPAIPPSVTEVVLSISASEVTFGESDPSVVQFFEPFLIEDGRCMWEPF